MRAVRGGRCCSSHVSRGTEGGCSPHAVVLCTPPSPSAVRGPRGASVSSRSADGCVRGGVLGTVVTAVETEVPGGGRLSRASVSGVSAEVCLMVMMVMMVILRMYADLVSPRVRSARARAPEGRLSRCRRNGGTRGRGGFLCSLAVGAPRPLARWWQGRGLGAVDIRGDPPPRPRCGGVRVGAGCRWRGLWAVPAVSRDVGEVGRIGEGGPGWGFRGGCSST